MRMPGAERRGKGEVELMVTPGIDIAPIGENMKDVEVFVNKESIPDNAAPVRSVERRQP